MPEEMKIRNPKPPSEKDLQVLQFMNDGNRINSAKALGLFQTTGIRDIIYRLKCAGYDIKHQDIGYSAKDGKRKVYREWFTTDNKIIPAGVKTEKELLKGTKDISTITKDMQVTINKPIPKQAELFSTPFDYGM